MPLLLLLFIASAPLTAFAHEVETRAGTDDYLRDEMDWTQEDLQTAAATEEREAFDTFTGTGTTFDPLGDVLTRLGTTSTIAAPWGDVERATLSKNDAAQTWDLHVILGGAIPENPTYEAQLFFFVDSDADETNNEVEGIRIYTDAQFDVQHGEEGWFSDFRWYNPDEDFWAMNRETVSTFEIADNAFTLHIPYAELSQDLIPRWRVVMAISDGGVSQLDAAPTIGFPPVKNQEVVAEDASSDALWMYAILAAAAGTVIIYAIRVTRGRKAEPRA